jgi:hypothetical protein
VRVDQLGPEVMVSIRDLLPDIETEPTNGHLNLLFQAGEEDGILTALLDILRHHQVTVNSIEGHPPGLEEVFEHFTTQEQLEEDAVQVISD